MTGWSVGLIASETLKRWAFWLDELESYSQCKMELLFIFEEVYKSLHDIGVRSSAEVEVLFDAQQLSVGTETQC